MGLDAVVYCDCLERGRLRTPPKAEWGVFTGPDGARDTVATDLDVQIDFDCWSYSDACEHEDGVCVHERIGNIALVAALNRTLSASGLPFPIILEQVIYSGTHCGDWLPVELVKELEIEVARLMEVQVADPEAEQMVRNFESQLRTLMTHSLSLKKPIVF